MGEPGPTLVQRPGDEAGLAPGGSIGGQEAVG